MKKRYFEDFMAIEMSERDISEVEVYLSEGLPIYSKIIVQFEEGFDIEQFEEEPPYDEFNDDMACWDFNASQHIYYSISEDAFKDVVNYFKDYDCMIIQFHFINTLPKYNENLQKRVS